MVDKPRIDQLMALGSLAPESQEKDKPTVDVALTAAEIQALAILSNARFQMLFDKRGSGPREMAAIYLHLTSKLTLALLQIQAKAELDKD